MFELGCVVKADEPLARYSSFKIGGNASYVAEVSNKKALRVLLDYIKTAEIKIFIVGGGTNVLFDDKGYNGIIVKLTGSFETVSFQGGGIVCGAGADMGTIVRMSAENGYKGLEFMSGIPGSAGGAGSFP